MQSAPPQSKCDIVYLAKGRPEFTMNSCSALSANTNWSRVSRVLIYTDGGGVEYLPAPPSVVIEGNTRPLGGPVAIMNHYLSPEDGAPALLWAKIDNDVIVPPGWLDACLDVMDAHPELDLLGIEPPESRTPAPWMRSRVPAPEDGIMQAYGENPQAIRRLGYAACDSIGGIGVFRSRAWANRPPMRPRGAYGGFGDWAKRTNCVCGWIVPPLKLFLLDRLPMDPWASLSQRYIAEGQQRSWTNYSQAEAESLAGWWLK